METDHILRLLQKCLSEGQPEDWQQLRKELARGGQEQVQNGPQLHDCKLP